MFAKGIKIINRERRSSNTNLTLDYLKSQSSTDDGGCWNWNKHRNNYGYGVTSYKRKLLLTHRVSAELAYGPSNLHVIHSCDNPACCNPDHLSYGTRSDNMKDSRDKGRAGNQKLNWDVVKDIRLSELSGKELAVKYQVTPTLISRIRTGKAWIA